MQHVIPAPTRATTVDDAYAGPLGSHPDRPWIGLAMVASIDGSTVVDGTSGGLSSANDIAVFSRLRSIADVIIVGAQTVRGEGYGPPKKAGQRIGVVSGRGSVDTTTELFRSGAGFVITTERAEFDESGVDVIRAGDDRLDLASAIHMVRELCPGTDFIQAEGGATLNAALGAAGLLDELNITTSPRTVGGDGLRLFGNGEDHARAFELAQLVVDDESFVFSRWRHRSAPTSP